MLPFERFGLRRDEFFLQPLFSMSSAAAAAASPSLSSSSSSLVVVVVVFVLSLLLLLFLLFYYCYYYYFVVVNTIIVIVTLSKKYKVYRRRLHGSAHFKEGITLPPLALRIDKNKTNKKTCSVANTTILIITKEYGVFWSFRWPH